MIRRLIIYVSVAFFAGYANAQTIPASQITGLEERFQQPPIGYWNDLPNRTDSRAVRIANRLFLGRAASAPLSMKFYNAGAVPECASWGALGFPCRDGLLVAISPNGRPAASFITRSSKAAGSPFEKSGNAINVGFYAENDTTDTTVGIMQRLPTWGAYFDVIRRPNAGYTTGFELDIGETGGDSIDIHPYAYGNNYQTRVSTAIELRSGGAATNAVYHNATAAINIGPNPARFKTGINVSNNALAPDASGFGPFLKLPAQTKLAWYRPDGVESFAIASTATTSNVNNSARLVFSDFNLETRVGGALVTRAFSDLFAVYGKFVQASIAPAHSNSPCLQGELAWDGLYEYRCIAANSWKRIAYLAGTW